jgi:hypothetical protein
VAQVEGQRTFEDLIAHRFVVTCMRSGYVPPEETRGALTITVENRTRTPAGEQPRWAPVHLRDLYERTNGLDIFCSAERSEMDDYGLNFGVQLYPVDQVAGSTRQLRRHLADELDFEEDSIGDAVFDRASSRIDGLTEIGRLPGGDPIVLDPSCGGRHGPSLVVMSHETLIDTLLDREAPIITAQTTLAFLNSIFDSIPTFMSGWQYQAPGGRLFMFTSIMEP